MRDSVLALQIFNVTRFVALFLVSVLLVKLPLTVDRIASYEYVLFLSSIVTGWWIHGFLQSFMSDSEDGKRASSEENFRAYSRLFVLFGSGILVVLMTGVWGLAAWNIMEPPPAGFYFFLFFHFVLQAGILMVYYFHQRKWSGYIYLYAGYFLMTYVGSFLFLVGDESFLPDVYRWLAVFSIPVVLVWLCLYLKSKTGTKEQISFWYIPHLSLLVLIQGIGFVSLWSDGFWVQYFYGTGDMFALFRYGGREFPLIIILTTTFSTAMIQGAVADTGLQRIRQGSIRFIKIFIPVVLGLLLTSQWLYSQVYSIDFVPASFIFDLYLLLIIVRVLFPRPILIASRLFKPLLWVTIGELVINVVVSFTLYWILGILGLVLGSLTAHFFELGASLYLVRTRLDIGIRRYIPVRLYLVFTIGVVMFFLVKYMWFSPQWLDQMVAPY